MDPQGWTGWSCWHSVGCGCLVSFWCLFIPSIPVLLCYMMVVMSSIDAPAICYHDCFDASPNSVLPCISCRVRRELVVTCCWCSSLLGGDKGDTYDADRIRMSILITCSEVTAQYSFVRARVRVIP